MKQIAHILLQSTMLSCLITSQNVSVFSIDLLTTTISQLKEAMSNGKITARDLVVMYLNRIDSVNLKGPKLRAVLETNPEAITIASRLDSRNDFKGKLRGIPILLKDNIATNDKMNTTAGSFALLGSKVSSEAFVVQQLRKSGAIILGKASMSEWSAFRSFRATRQGVSGRGGASKSAYITDGDPSGSSSGSAIAVSIGLCSVALGTETDGSIISPASRNGVVGLKPTVGLTSRSNVIPISSRQDSVGPLGKTVKDVALVLEVIQGFDPTDNYTRNIRSEKSYTRFLLGTDGFKNMRLGVLLPDLFVKELDKQVVDTFRKAIQTIRGYGGDVQDSIDFENIDKILNGTTELTVLVSEFKQNIEKYLSTLSNTKMRTLQNLIDFNIAHKDQEFNSYLPDQDLFEIAQNITVVTGELETQYRRLAKSLDHTMDKYKLDAIVSIAEYSSSATAISGQPIITVPLGYLNKTEGPEPFGIAFMGRAWSEGILLRLAHAFEQATHIREQVRPKYAPI